METCLEICLEISFCEPYRCRCALTAVFELSLRALSAPDTYHRVSLGGLQGAAGRGTLTRFGEWQGVAPQLPRPLRGGSMQCQGQVGPGRQSGAKVPSGSAYAACCVLYTVQCILDPRTVGRDVKEHNTLVRLKTPKEGDISSTKWSAKRPTNLSQNSYESTHRQYSDKRRSAVPLTPLDKRAPRYP